MLKYLKKRRVAQNPPTAKQVKYARMLKIQITDLMTREDVSAAIGKAEKANPELMQKLDQATQRSRIKRYGEAAVEAGSHWENITDMNPMVLLIFQRGKNTIVDVVMACGTEFDSKNKIKVCFFAPKLQKDRDLGEILDWDEEFSVRPNKILHHQPIAPEIHFTDIKRYRVCVQNGLKIAGKFAE